MAKAKTWVEKRDGCKESHVKVMEKSFWGMAVGSKMLIPSSLEVDSFVRTIPAGTVVKLVEVRKELAKKHGADVTCPVTMGFLLRNVAEAALEERASGYEWDEVAPFWRVNFEGTATEKKLSVGKEMVDAMRRDERG